MPNNVVVQTRIDSAVKARASAVLDGIGLTVSDAVRMLLTRIADEGTLPLTQPEDAKAYDLWFRAQVQEALDDPRPGIPHEEVEAQFNKLKADLRTRTASARR